MKNKKIIIIYGFLISSVLTFVSLYSAKNVTEIIGSLVYLPLVFFFFSQLITKKVPRAITPKVYSSIEPETVTTLPGSLGSNISDGDKRAFLKLIGSAGFSLFFMALFTKKAQAAFFGSVPGPGTVSIKNSAGVKIDPAESHPTDGYEIAEIDDASSPAYYGFLKKNGYWYILKEESSGAYRYAKGTSSFSTNWTGRAGLVYGYFDSVFG